MRHADFTTTPRVSVLVRFEAGYRLTRVVPKITPYNRASSPIVSIFFESHTSILSSKKEASRGDSFKQKHLGGPDRI